MIGSAFVIRVRAGRRGAVLATVTAVAAAAVSVAGCHGSGTAAAPTATHSPVKVSADPHTADPDPRHLRAGDCFTADAATLAGGTEAAQTVRIVPCAQSHQGEAFGTAALFNRPYPGAAQLAQDAAGYCHTLIARYDMDTWTLDPAAHPTRALYPGRTAWQAGDHNAVCFFTARSGTATGSMRRDGRTLTADQYAYLDAEGRFDAALALPPDELSSSDRSDWEQWTGSVADSLGIEEQLLKAHNWPVRTQAPVNALIQRIDTTTPLWRSASQTTSVADLLAGYTVAREHALTAQESAVRVTLDLATHDAAAKTGTGGTAPKNAAAIRS
jgi:hypothetical protein